MYIGIAGFGLGCGLGAAHHARRGSAFVGNFEDLTSCDLEAVELSNRGH